MAHPFDRCVPGWSELLTLWLETKFPGCPAAIFANPAEHMPFVSRYFMTPELGRIVMSEYAILPCVSLDSAMKPCADRNNADKGPFVMVWDGEKIVHHSG